MNIDIKDCKYILTIVEENNITRAAERLYMSQSALSQFIKHFEAKLNIRLFTRSRSGVELTSEGKIIVSYIKRVYDDYESLENIIGELSDLKRGKLTVGYSSSFSSEKIFELINKFHDQNPDIEIDFKEQHSHLLESALINGECDIAFFKVNNDNTHNKLVEYKNIDCDEIVVLLRKGSPAIEKIYYKDNEPYINVADLKNENFSIPLKNGVGELFSYPLKANNVNASINYGVSFSKGLDLVRLGMSSIIQFKSALLNRKIDGYCRINCGGTADVRNVAAYLSEPTLPYSVKSFLDTIDKSGEA